MPTDAFNGLSKGEEHPVYTLQWNTAPLPHKFVPNCKTIFRCSCLFNSAALKRLLCHLELLFIKFKSLLINRFSLKKTVKNAIIHVVTNFEDARLA